jgi:hypothetical protein
MDNADHLYDAISALEPELRLGILKKVTAMVLFNLGIYSLPEEFVADVNDWLEESVSDREDDSREEPSDD